MCMKADEKSEGLKREAHFSGKLLNKRIGICITKENENFEEKPNHSGKQSTKE